MSSQSSSTRSMLLETTTSTKKKTDKIMVQTWKQNGILDKEKKKK
jgi:hypothetical protein